MKNVRQVVCFVRPEVPRKGRAGMLQWRVGAALFGARHGTYHKMSEKHPDRYVSEFAGRHNHRPLDTIDQMSAMANA